MFKLIQIIKNVYTRLDKAVIAWSGDSQQLNRADNVQQLNATRFSTNQFSGLVSRNGLPLNGCGLDANGDGF
jgi:hypothetical protein